MKKEYQDKFFKHYYKSIKYSLQGLKETFQNERSFHLWLVCFLIMLGGSFWFHFTFRDYGIMFVLFALILVVELLNTAIEHTVDLVTKEINPLAKKAKDCGAAATFVVTMMALIFGILMIMNYL